MSKSTNRGHYTNVFSAWSKALGPQPTEAQLATAHVFGRPGKQALGIAMAMRDQGMNTAQMCGASALFDGKPTPCRNKLIGTGGLVQAGLFTREPLPHAIKITLSDAGRAWVVKAAQADKATPVKAEPAKVRAVAGDTKGKAVTANRIRKPKAPKAVTEPVAPVEVPPVATVPEVTSEGATVN